MSRRKIMLAATFALLLLCGGWYFGSPWWTLWRMRDAAAARDMRRLVSYVDLAAVTAHSDANARAFWSSVLRTVPPTNEGGRRLIDLAKRKLAALEQHKLADPEEFRPWLAEIPIDIAGVRRPTKFNDYRPFIVHRGLDRFEVRHRGNPDNGYLGFRRHGLGWKLEAVEFSQQ